MLKNFGELLVSLVFLVLLGIKLDPFGWTMPDEIQMIVLCLLIAAFAIYAGLLFREKAHDEREEVHIHKASRAAYLGGISLLVLALVVQTLTKSMDPWVILILGGMILIKMFVLAWIRSRN